MKKNKENLKACLIGGAIGDALGSKYENQQFSSILTDFNWKISDDTQLTLATCEAIYNQKVDPAKVAAQFLTWFNQRKLTGLGASTLKALRELQLGGHWALVGRTGEYAAGNGAAMRIAPLAFKKEISRLTIRDICTITHKNEEAYVGALAVFYALQIDIHDSQFLEKVSNQLPDTHIKDRLFVLSQRKNDSISEIIADYPSSGYVVDSVPLSLFAAQKAYSLSFQEVTLELIQGGGDTDTVCSMTGQIIGVHKGLAAFPKKWLEKYQELNINSMIDKLVDNWKL